MTADDNKGTIRAWVEAAWNRGEIDGHDHLYAPSYAAPFLPPPFPQNFDGLKAFIRHFRAGMPDFRLEIEEMVAEGDRVAWRMTASGTQTGEFLGFPPTGRSARIEGHVLSRFEHGKWAEDHAVWDALGLLQQLGHIPVPQPAGA